MQPIKPSAEAQPPIEAHGIVGDMRSAALIADTGSVDFFCWPEFDSPSVFTALLDSPEAGVFELAPELEGTRRQQIYLPDTNVLKTRWLGGTSVVELTDFMPVCADPGALPRLVRRIQVVQGQATIRLRCAVRLDYARAETQARLVRGDVCFEAGGQPTLRLCASQPLRIDGQAAVARFELQQGEHADFVLGGDEDERVDFRRADADLAETIAFWHGWMAQSSYRGRWREMVDRSVLTLKLLTSRQRGAIVAAATFGLPETRGGERNWDYRYSWVRDASFTVYAFLRLGFAEEARGYMRWLHQRIGATQEGPRPLRIVYGVDGREALPEETLDHLQGYDGARPVRVGNGAYQQKQLDIFGELLDAVYLVNKYSAAISHDAWQHVTRLVDHVCQVWRDTDVGIWEMRGEPQHFLHSRLMCWVALDRALRLAAKRSLPAPFTRWDAERQAIYDDIWSHFWDAERGHFVQRIGSHEVDASMLLMPLMRFVSATDPRWLATLKAIEEQLVRDGLVYRYRTEGGLDGLAGEEGAFAACSFWYVECLARAGRVDQARLEFEQLLRYASPLGLYAEEFDRHGCHLGNTPQALTHLALISAAFFLDRRLGHDKSQWQP